MDNLTFSQIKVSREHLVFDLEQFMMNKGASSGAVVLITPNQFVMTDCFVRRESDPTYGEHGAAINGIYQAIYKDPEEVKGAYHRPWQKQVMQDNNICIQLCSDCSSVVSIPEVITNKQFFMLQLLNNKIREIYERNRDYFDNNPMEFISWKEGSSVNNIDGILENVKIGDISYSFDEEVILGNDIRQLDYQLDNNHISRR